MFGSGGKILQHGWFCTVKDCDGYGGPVHEVKKQKAKSQVLKATYTQEKLL